MPPLPSVAKVIRIALRHQWNDNTDVLSRFFLSYTGTAPTVAQLDTYASTVGTAWGTDLKGLAPPAVVLQDVTIEDLTSNTAAVGFASSVVAGTRTGGALSPGDAAIMKYQIGRRYRGGHPRGYWPFGTDSDVGSSSLWTGAFTASFLGSWNSFVNTIIAGGWTGAGTLAHVNVSYYAGFTNVLYPSGRYRAVPTRRAAPVVDPVVQYSVNPRVGSQRRRNLQP